MAKCDDSIVHLDYSTNKETTNEMYEKLQLSELSHNLNRYATNKTYANGFLNLALLSINFRQFKQLIQKRESKEHNNKTTAFDTFLIILVSISICFQLMLSFYLILMVRRTEFLHKSHQFKLIKKNNLATALVSVVSGINFFVNIAMNQI
jgi:hypothetical protein